MPLLRMFRVFVCCVLALTAMGVCGQNSLANQTIKWDDYTYKFLSTGQSAQVFDSAGKVVGTILSMNGDLQMIPLPGTDEEKLKKSFADWKAFYARSHSAGGSSSAGATATPAASSSNGGPAVPCPSTYGVSYFDGTAWKTMMLAVQMPKEKSVSLSQGFKDMGKNPLNPRAGETMIYRYKDPAAPLTTGPNPSFCVSISANFNPSQIMIGTVDIKKDHREIEQAVSSRDSWLPPKRVQQVDIKRVSETVVVVTPKTPLPPGQYVLGGPPMVGIYDFGVRASQ
ncbi:hypothetical protein [Alloacidobacterium sp.]|uniref:hypothetical protein n=1 Tax=Alloacidobacterium sp. TaxID=2951999 RepID=UPI002D4CEE0B|nr:hypothetical protein [Alloacidobacterium sp.]HYK36009.1 hypothetical protein [Alloacidobacterium sp.]